MKAKTLPYQQGKWTIIYDARLLRERAQSKRKRRLGSFFLCLSLVGFSFLLSPTIILKFRPPRSIPTASAQKPSVPYQETTQEFVLRIPRLEIEAKVEPSVDIANPQTYQEALELGVAHAKGTALPDEPGSVYIFGHSTDFPWNIKEYHAFFYRLKDVAVGDKISIAYHGESFEYQIQERKVVTADDLDYLLSKSGQNRLVLQTCWPPGTTWKRLIVLAKPIKKS